MVLNVRRLTPADHSRLLQFFVEHWGSDFMVSRGTIYRPEQLEGFVIEDGDEWVGLLTYFIQDDELEVTSLDSLREGQGLGTELMNAVMDVAQEQKCQRVFLITTNDNLNALGFYQKRGFELVTIYRGALNETRKLKPNIPFIGHNNIPLRDEIELELSLRGGA